MALFQGRFRRRGFRFGGMGSSDIRLRGLARRYNLWTPEKGLESVTGSESRGGGFWAHGVRSRRGCWGSWESTSLRKNERRNRRRRRGLIFCLGVRSEVLSKMWLK